MKKITHLLLTCSTLSAWSLTASATLPVITPQAPNVLITSAADLLELANFVQSDSYRQNPFSLKIKLGSDITCYNMQPIGLPASKGGQPFIGEFDGQGHTITFEMYDQPQSDYMGLFGYIGTASQSGSSANVVKNLVITNAIVKGHSNVGGVAGYARHTTFDNVWVSGCDVIGTGIGIGGIVGSTEAQCEIKSCSVAHQQTGSSRRLTTIGCEATSFTNSPGRIGGIAGYASNTRITDCLCLANVEARHGGQDIGGIVGHHYVSSSYWNISGCAYKGEIKAAVPSPTYSTGDQNGSCVGGIAGYTSGASSYEYTYCAAFPIISASASDANTQRVKAGRIYGWCGSRSDYATAPQQVNLVHCYCAADAYAYTASGSESDKINAFPADDGGATQPYNVCGEDFRSGAVALTINMALGRERFAQNLCNDEVPFPASINITHDHDGISPHADADHDGMCNIHNVATHSQRPDFDGGPFKIANRDHYLWYKDVAGILMPTDDLYFKGWRRLTPAFDAKLTADIDLTGVDNPLICCKTQPFILSTFDGQGHTISGINFTEITDAVKGLGIAFIGKARGSVIKNIKFSNCHITAVDNVGMAVGNALNCEVYGIYTDHTCTVTGKEHVGGIVGYADLSTTGLFDDHPITISHCTNSATVTGSSVYSTLECKYVGGIAGAVGCGSIDHCFNNGSVGINMAKGAAIGGIVGTAWSITLEGVGSTAPINNDAPEAWAHDTPSVGGILGYANNATLSNCYFTGTSIHGKPASTGALLGAANDMKKVTLINCLYNSEATEIDGTHPLPYQGYTEHSDIKALTNDDMQSPEVFSSFAADDTNWTLISCRDGHNPMYYGCWFFDDGTPNAGTKVLTRGYSQHGPLDTDNHCTLCNATLNTTEPQLPPISFEKPQLANDGFYLIQKAEHLQWLRDAVNLNTNPEATFNCRLQNNIDLASYDPWESIGHDNYTIPYQGEFDGNGKTIRGLRASAMNTTTNCYGLFAFLNEAYIHDLNLEAGGWTSGGLVWYHGGNEYLGAIAGLAANSRFERITITGALHSEASVAGIAAIVFNSTFTDCTNEANIWSQNNDPNLANVSAAGIAANVLSSSTFTRCINQASNYGIESNKFTHTTAGIAGYATANTTFTDCANRASIKTQHCYSSVDDGCKPGCGHSNAGGIIGRYEHGSIDPTQPLTINRCYNYADMPDITRSGAIAGYTNGYISINRTAYNSTAANNKRCIANYTTGQLIDDNWCSFTDDEFANGTAAQYLGTPWGHTFIDDGIGEIFNPDDLTFDTYPMLCRIAPTRATTPQANCWPLYRDQDNNLRWLGDTDCDNDWSTTDIHNLANTTLDPESATIATLHATDINGDGNTTIADMTLLLNFMKRLESLKNGPEGPEEPWEPWEPWEPEGGE